MRLRVSYVTLTLLEHWVRMKSYHNQRPTHVCLWSQTWRITLHSQPTCVITIRIISWIITMLLKEIVVTILLYLYYPSPMTPMKLCKLYPQLHCTNITLFELFFMLWNVSFIRMELYCSVRCSWQTFHVTLYMMYTCTCTVMIMI